MSLDSFELRDNPTDAFIEKIRQTYVVESEIDRVLTRKMKRRSGPQYRAISLEDIVRATSALIRNRTGVQFELLNAKWLGGGASKIQVFLELVFESDHQEFVKGEKYSLVLRMEPSESVVETSRKREFEVLQIVSDRIPVPTPYWIDNDAEFLPYPGLIYQFVAGVTKVSGETSKQVSGIGTQFAVDVRSKLANQFVRHLADLHCLPQERLSTLESFDKPLIGSNDSAIKQVNWWRRVWEEDRGENTPIVDIAYQWLINNAPTIERLCLVHGDFRNGNFLFDQTSCEIKAWLDWELCLLGDHHQDIAWVAFDLFSTQENGHEMLCGLIEKNQFLDQYQQISGLNIDSGRLKYYSILCLFMAVVHMLATAYRVAKGGKSHQDIVVSSFSKMGYTMLARLRNALEEVI